MGKAGMHAQKSILIESKVLKEIPEEDKTMEFSLKYGGDLPSVLTLGMFWEAKENVFTFNDAPAPCCKQSEHSKQGFLKNISTPLDPFGFLSSYVALRKGLLQEI